MKSLEELRALRTAAQATIGIRNDDAAKIKVTVGMGTCGIAAGARSVLNALTDAIAKNGLYQVAVYPTECAGDCANEPIVEVYAENQEKVTYVKMDAEKAARVVAEHLAGGKVVTEYTGK